MNIEWALVFFTLFVGLSVGTFAGVVLTEWWGKAEQVRLPGAITALVALVIGGISSVLHLGHPERIFGALGHPTSGIFTEALLIGLFGLDIVAYMIAMRRNASGQARKTIATIGLVPAILLSFGVGYTYVLPSRPAWDTWILPVLYVVSAAVMGCFSLSVLIASTKATGTNATTAATVNRTTLATLGIQALLLVAYLVHLSVAPYGDATRSAARVLTGDLAPLFWIGLVLIGLLAPMMLMTRLRAKGAESFSLPLSSAQLGLLCVLVAGVAFRVLMFSLGSSVRSFF
jgi:anaerobic dimethyl sulfoxide reductase subunit C (anchor subunit)